MKTLNKDLAAIQLNQAIEQLKQDDSILMQAYCDYSAENGFDSVYDNDEDSINMMFDNTHDALRAAFYGDYNPSHAYFTFNGYGNLQSFEYLDSDNSPIDIGELAQWLINEDKLSEYDLTVTTLDDMLASIEGNIADDENMLLELSKLLSLKVNSVEKAMTVLSEYNYKQLMIVINHLGINYQ